MSHRELFFGLLSGQKLDRVPFFPDITDWYKARRTLPGQPQRFKTGEFISGNDPFHQENVDMPDEYSQFTLLDFYKHYDWGLPVHIYHWYDVEYDNVDRYEKTAASKRITQFVCPTGKIERIEQMAADGSYCPCEHFAKDLKDLKTIEYIVSHTRMIPRYDLVTKILQELGQQGVADIVINRSPFGKLVHEYMGFENTVYALSDEQTTILKFLDFLAEYDIEVIKMAANSPARIIIVSDHADEHLIAPNYYKQFCVPFYNKACDIFHEKCKIVSTHLDGNFKGYFPYIKETKFDLLDGCTPAPMNNYEIEELSKVLNENMYTYCGIPSTLFVQNLKDSAIIEFAARILNALKGRLILNVGDVLPPNGNLNQVIKVGEWLKTIT